MPSFIEKIGKLFKKQEVYRPSQSKTAEKPVAKPQPKPASAAKKPAAKPRRFFLCLSLCYNPF